MFNGSERHTEVQEAEGPWGAASGDDGDGSEAACSLYARYWAQVESQWIRTSRV